MTVCDRRGQSHGVTARDQPPAVAGSDHDPRRSIALGLITEGRQRPSLESGRCRISRENRVDLRAFALSMSRPAPVAALDRVIALLQVPRVPQEKACALCEAPFAPRIATQRFCSRSCAARSQWIGKNRPEPPPRLVRHKAGDHSLCSPDRPGHGICAKCGKTVQAGRSSAPPERRRCLDCARSEPKKTPEPRICALCEESYVPKLSHRPDQRWCSKSCTTAWLNGARPPYTRVADGDYKSRKIATQRHRLRVHAETWDGVTNTEIMERDHWRCGICRKVIGKSFKWPHPRSKSIDHIVPVSQGGDDTAGNKRAAHLGCNCARMNRGGGEQAALF